MITFEQLAEKVATGGQAPGKLELHSTSVKTALAWAEKAFSVAGRDLHEDISNFEHNFEVAKHYAIGGTLKRNEMPVITSRDVKALEKVMKEAGVKVTKGKMVITAMRPLQYQIYVDKALNVIIKNGVEKTRKFLTSGTMFILSSDDYIMEGHHRFLNGILFDPTMKSPFIQFDMKKDDLLKFLLMYTSKIGNTRNEEFYHG